MDTVEVVGQPYTPRVIDLPLANALGTAGAVVIEGARATGKTMTAINAAASYVFVDAPETQQLLEIAPRAVLEGAPPRLVDEWQLAPQLWNLIRRQVDASAQKGRFILTGSSVPVDDATRHTGAGRILRLQQRTLSWWEKQGRPEPQVSLRDLFDGHHPTSQAGSAPDLADVLSLLLRPGFPAMATLTPEQSAQLLRAYAQDVASTDIFRLAEIRHEPAIIEQLIAALARSIANEVSYATLAADIRSAAPAIRGETVSHYVELLRRLFLVEAQAAWTPRLQSRARLRTSPRLHLVDPALAAAVLGADAARLTRELSTLGQLFESAVVHDLAVLATPLGGEVRHFRDSNGNEIDAVLTLGDGRWAAVEIKLGGLQIEAGATSLRKAITQIDASSAGAPAFRLIVTGTGPALTLADGTVTCPLTALGP